jgi:hypothetical protein
MECIIPGGIHMESTWKWDGIHVEDSTWIPSGHSIWNGGIHVEFGHSMWNMGGMESPKWVGSQPKHIPYGMGGIHLE